MRILSLLSVLLLLSAVHACTRYTSQPSGEASPPFADVHIHFNWDQPEHVTAQEVVAILNKHNVVMAIGFSTPTEHILELNKAGGDIVIPFFSPYTTVRGRHTWFNDESVLIDARKGLEQKVYFGIGEVHVISGIGPRRDNKILNGLLKLADEFQVPFNIHTEASSYQFLETICQRYPKVRFLWAHAGGSLGPDHAEAIIKSCPNVWIELSARDPHHYGGLIEDDGSLRKGWKQVMIKYPDRFMVGTDPVWNAHQVDRWYEADEGWKHYEKFIRFHRELLEQLPPDVEKKIRLENAVEFFGK